MCEYNEDLYGPRECPDNLIQVDYEKLEELILNRSREIMREMKEMREKEIVERGFTCENNQKYWNYREKMKLQNQPP